ncbi:hypothetical protein N9K23_02885, partial [Planktomarina temperata]|nr:hypothetical protein [Planktomarina temperata]
LNPQTPFKRAITAALCYQNKPLVCKSSRAWKFGVAMSNKQINFIGWILFILSAIGFIIASIGSFWSMVGSVFFLVACLVFLIPFFRSDD